VFVLVVDDDEEVRNLIEDALRMHAYEVVTTATEQEAEEVRQRLGTVDMGLVICDINLTANAQAQEGYALYQRWTTVAAGLPFLLISGDPQAISLPAIRTGAVRFLPKPFSINDLITAVQALIRQ
jgi:DNA-binding NtrC family response regulator